MMKKQSIVLSKKLHPLLSVIEKGYVPAGTPIGVIKVDKPPING